MRLLGVLILLGLLTGCAAFGGLRAGHVEGHEPGGVRTMHRAKHVPQMRGLAWSLIVLMLVPCVTLAPSAGATRRH